MGCCGAPSVCTAHGARRADRRAAPGRCMHGGCSGIAPCPHQGRPLEAGDQTAGPQLGLGMQGKGAMCRRGRLSGIGSWCKQVRLHGWPAMALCCQVGPFLYSPAPNAPRVAPEALCRQRRCFISRSAPAASSSASTATARGPKELVRILPGSW